MTNEQIDEPAAKRKPQGLRAVVHAHAADGAKAAILAGCTGIEHGTMLDNANPRPDARQRRVFRPQISWSCTIYIDNKPKYLNIGNYTEEGFVYMEKAFPLISDVLRRARAHKVMVVFGTDAVAGSHGRNFRRIHLPGKRRGR